MTIIEAVNQIASEKKEKHIFPTHALVTEIMKVTGLDKDQIMSEATRLGLEVGRTINNNYVK